MERATTPGEDSREPMTRGGRAAVGGVIASSLLVLVMAGVEASPITPILPGSTGPSGGGKAAVAVVIACLSAAAFLYAALQGWRGNISERWAIGLGIGLFAAVLAAPLLFSRDAYNYAIYGRIVSEYGQNPYTTVPADVSRDPFFSFSGPKWAGDPSVYGPAFTALSAGVTSMVHGVVAVTFAFKLIASLAGIATMFLVRSLARSLAPGRAVFAVILFAWDPVVVFNAAGGGHNDLLLALSVAGGLALVCARRPMWAIGVLTLGTLVKATGGIPLLLLVVWVIASAIPGQRRRTAIQAIAIPAVLTAAFALPFWQMENPTLGIIEVAGHSGGFAVSAFFQRAADLLPGAGAVVHVGFLVAFLFLFIMLAVRVARTAAGSSTPSVAELGAAWGWAFVVFMLATPFFLPWYLAWMLPVAFLLPKAGRGVVLAAVTACIVFQVVSEPLRSQAWYEAITFARDWAVRPIVFGAIGFVVVRELWTRWRSGAPLSDAPEHIAGDPSQQDASEPARQAGQA